MDGWTGKERGQRDRQMGRDREKEMDGQMEKQRQGDAREGDRQMAR